MDQPTTHPPLQSFTHPAIYSSTHPSTIQSPIQQHSLIYHLLSYIFTIWSPIHFFCFYCPHLPIPFLAVSPPSRIYEILPQRIQQWKNSPCIAEEHGKKMLERIHREQQDTQTYLKDMERHFHELEAIILRGKQQAVYNNEEVSGIGRVKQKVTWYLALPIPSLHCFTVLCRKAKMAGTAVT